MPEICRPCTNKKFKLCIYADDHPPPHVHVRGPNVSAILDLGKRQVTRGWVPNTAPPNV